MTGVTGYGSRSVDYELDWWDLDRSRWSNGLQLKWAKMVEDLMGFGDRRREENPASYSPEKRDYRGGGRLIQIFDHLAV